jgi:hypothetical protein
MFNKYNKIENTVGITWSCRGVGEPHKNYAESYYAIEITLVLMQ